MSELKDLNRETGKILSSTPDWLVIEEPNESWASQLKFEETMAKGKQLLMHNTIDEMNEQELEDIDAYSAWHQSQLDQQREEEERAIQPSTHEIIGRLNSAISILDIIDPQIQGITDQLMAIRDRLKKSEKILAEELAAQARKTGIL